MKNIGLVENRWGIAECFKFQFYLRGESLKEKLLTVPKNPQFRGKPFSDKNPIPTGSRRGDDLLAEPVRGTLKKPEKLPNESNDPSSDPSVPGQIVKGSGRKRRDSRPDVKDTGEERFYAWFKYVILIVLGLGICLLIGTVIYKFQASGPVPNSDVSKGVERLLDPQILKSEYIAANGGLEFLESVRSARAHGTFETLGETRTIFILKRVPNQMVFRLSDKNTSVKFGTNGDTVWQSFSKDGQILKVILLEGENARSIRYGARFFGGLMESFLNDEGQVLEIQEDEINESAVLRIDVGDGPGMRVVRYFVDVESLDLLRMENVQGDTKIVETYSNYRSIASLRQPFSVLTEHDGEFHSLITFEDMDLNAGVLSMSFERPISDVTNQDDGSWNIEREARDKGAME